MAASAETTKHQGSPWRITATTVLIHQCLKLLIGQLWTWIIPSWEKSPSSKRLSKCYHHKSYSSIMLIFIWIVTTITVCTSSQSWVVHPSSWKYFLQVSNKICCKCTERWKRIFLITFQAHDRMKRGVKAKEHMCADAPNKNLCLPKSYSKFELPFTESVNVVEIGIDIIDVLRINDKVRKRVKKN